MIHLSYFHFLGRVFVGANIIFRACLSILPLCPSAPVPLALCWLARTPDTPNAAHRLAGWLARTPDTPNAAHRLAGWLARTPDTPNAAHRLAGWLAAGCWLLAAGCWLLAAGCWLLAAGCWLLAAGPTLPR